MTYNDGVAQSLQLFEDGELIKDTQHIVSITAANNSPLPTYKGPYGTDRSSRRLVSGFIVNNEIMDGSYAEHSYTCRGDKYLE